MDLNKMRLPKVNKRKQQSNLQQNALEVELLKTIVEFEKKNNYRFLPYEVDNVLLKIIKRSQESYLSAKFGNDMV